MTERFLSKKLLAVLATCAAILLSGCGRDDAPALLSSARDYQAKNDHNAAIIQLKNVLQKQPENGEARLLLGQSALVLGDAPTAEKELRKALEYGQPPAIVVPLIAAALLQGGSPDKVISEFGEKTLDDAKANAELKAHVGEAHLGKGDPKSAATAFATALQSDPANVRAQLGNIRLMAGAGKLPEATSDAEKLAAAYPTSPDAHLLVSQLKLAQGDRAGAVASLQRAIDAAPANAGPRLQLIALLIADHQLDAATAQIAAARAARAPALQLLFFESQVAAGNKDFAKAREIVQQVLKKAPGHVPSLVLLGGLELQDKQYVQAQAQLQSALAIEPRHMGARSLLARSYLASNQPARALETLQPVIGTGAELDPSMLMLVGEAQFASGDLKQAATSFDAASKSKAQQPLAETRLAQIAVVSGDVEGGVRKLESLAADEGASAQTEMALLAGYLRQGETARALDVARGMVKKRPNDPAAHHTLGSVLLIRKETAQARAAFSKAVELNPTFMPAVAALAQLDLQENKTAEARARFEAVLVKEPKNENALLGLAEVMARAKAPSSEIIAVLKRAIDANPQSVNARLALINLHLRDRDNRAALTAAQEAAGAVGKDSRVLDALGRAQAAAGETNQAIDTFNRLAAAEPKSIVPLMRLASLHASANEMDKAVDALLRAQRIAPADMNVTRDLAVAYLAQGKRDEALKQARALQKSAPKSAVGLVLEGDVYSSSKEWPAAEKAYREGLKVEPASSSAAIRLHSMLLAATKTADADGMARKWVVEHPKDAVFRGYLAERALRTRDYKGAVTHYEAVVEQQPDNAIALNNLAWALGQLGDARAIGYAERALKVAPDSASVLDTAGTLL